MEYKPTVGILHLLGSPGLTNGPQPITSVGLNLGFLFIMANNNILSLNKGRTIQEAILNVDRFV